MENIFGTVGILGSGTAALALRPGKSIAAARRLTAVLNELIEDKGARRFLCVPDRGEGLLATEILLRIAKARGDLTVFTVLPHEGLVSDWQEGLRNRFYAAVESSDGERMLRTRPTGDDNGLCYDWLCAHAGAVLTLTGTGTSLTVRPVPDGSVA